MPQEVMSINENDLKKIICETVKKVIVERYTLSSTDELMEYMWLKPQITGLNVDIFVDDGGSYQRNGHTLLLWVRNGYSKSIAEFIPFSISNTPQILDENIDYNITYNDIFAIQDFIVFNLQNLALLANQKISQKEFVNTIKTPSYAITEKKEILSEMATLRAQDSNLPMDIWLDEGATYQGHAPRLKFRASNEQRTTREFSSMLLTDPPTIENMPSNSPIKKKDIDTLKSFVVKNLDLLLKLANGEIDYLTDFLPNMEIVDF